jgi:hypothetical protein
MRRRLLLRVLAMTIAVMIGATGTVALARADDGEPPPGPVVDFVFAVFNLIRGGVTAPNLQALIQAAIGASNRATNEVIVHLDAYEAEDARSSAMSATREFADFDVMVDDDLGMDYWAQRTADNATRIRGQLNVAGWGRAADQMGHAAMVTYPLGLTGYKFAGRVNGYDLLMQNYKAVTDKIIRDLAPHCSSTDHPLVDRRQYPLNRVYQCTAADGHASGQFTEFWGADATLQSPAVNLELLKDSAAANSSWLVAKRIRPTLGP